MDYIRAFKRPALLIIIAIVLINAGTVLYFNHRSNIADDHLRQQAAVAKRLAEQNRRLLEKQEVERHIRADQTCQLLEGQHLSDVQQLRGNYSFLLQAQNDPKEKNGLLYKIVLKALPQLEIKAQIDSAPEYCDAPATGLPEPDPKIPNRPKALGGHQAKPPILNTQDLRNK